MSKIDYERMNKVYPKQKAALTRAIKSGDADRIISTVAAAVVEWDEIGAWPDGWHRWQNALDDALPWNDRIDMRDL